MSNTPPTIQNNSKSGPTTRSQTKVPVTAQGQGAAEQQSTKAAMDDVGTPEPAGPSTAGCEVLVPADTLHELVRGLEDVSLTSKGGKDAKLSKAVNKAKVILKERLDKAMRPSEISPDTDDHTPEPADLPDATKVNAEMADMLRQVVSGLRAWDLNPNDKKDMVLLKLAQGSETVLERVPKEVKLAATAVKDKHLDDMGFRRKKLEVSQLAPTDVTYMKKFISNEYHRMAEKVRRIMPVKIKNAEEAAHRANIDLLLVESLAVMELEGYDNVHLLTEWDFRNIRKGENRFLSSDGRTIYSFTGRADYVYICTRTVLRAFDVESPEFFIEDLAFRVVIIEAKTDKALDDSLIQAVVESILADLATKSNSRKKHQGQIRFILASANRVRFGGIDMDASEYYCSDYVEVEHTPLTFKGQSDGPFETNCLSRLTILTLVKDWLCNYSNNENALYSRFIRPKL